ncbi:hypothetical protein ZIOFF_047176 [Zingiber officinale]|uniref:Uncharacterized protein n=1 Tax=Zingiber officinale TaxID=94328 RepID=A0A8J5FSN5_ZINOF|nr:hypothetical protein ZIOFF_047176 [Zingiber officinale]
MARLRYEAQRRLYSSRNGSGTLESQLNPEAMLELSQRRRVSLVPAETLYSTNWNAGVNALIVLQDTRWRDDRSIIGTMEVDLSGVTQLVYIAPNMLISVEDFFHHIELAIQTHDYLASTGIHAVSASQRTITELQGMRWTLQPPTVSQIRNPQVVRTTTLLDGSISLSFQGYQSAKNSQPRRLSNLDIEEIRNEGEKEFAGVFTSEYALPLFHEEYGYPDTNNRWDTLGEPSDRYNYYVNYAAPLPQPFIPATRPSWGDEDEDNTDDEVVFPSIWEDTPWEEDPGLDPNGFAPANEDEEDLESYFLGLSNLEADYLVISPNSVVEEVEQVEEQFYATQTNNLPEKMNELSVQEETSSTKGEPNDWLHQGSSQNIQSTEEAAHVGTDSLLTEQLERMDYPILPSMMQQATTEKALSITSAIYRSHIPNLSKLLGPLYSKTSPHGDRRFKTSDWTIIKEVKALVQTFPDLELPPADAYIIIETDGCMEGWGGVCKWKQSKFVSRRTEKICAYASGKFP